MGTSQGNGGRTSGGTVQQIVIPAGFDASDDFVKSHKGKTATPIPGLADGLMATLVMGRGKFTFTADNISQDQTFQTRCRNWAKDTGCLVEFSGPVKDGTKITRSARAYLAKDATDAMKSALVEQREAYEAAIAAAKAASDAS